jgi:hypothetical protein
LNIKGGINKMAKLSAWLITLIGILLVLALLFPTVFTGMLFNWVIALAVLIVGIGKLVRNYSNKRKR